MKVTIDLTDDMIAKLETFRTDKITELRRLVTDTDSEERSAFVSGVIEEYKIKPLDMLLFSYLHE